MVEVNSPEGGGVLGLLFTLLGLAIGLGVYLFFCYCAKLICEKLGHQPGILIWIPIVNFIPLLTVAKMPLWTIIPLIIPVVGVVVFAILWFKICEARGKSGWLVLLFFIPVVNFFVLPYLAFSE